MSKVGEKKAKTSQRARRGQSLNDKNEGKSRVTQKPVKSIFLYTSFQRKKKAEMGAFVSVPTASCSRREKTINAKRHSFSYELNGLYGYQQRSQSCVRLSVVNGRRLYKS